MFAIVSFSVGYFRPNSRPIGKQDLLLYWYSFQVDAFVAILWLTEEGVELVLIIRHIVFLLFLEIINFFLAGIFLFFTKIFSSLASTEHWLTLLDAILAQSPWPGLYQQKAFRSQQSVKCKETVTRCCVFFGFYNSHCGHTFKTLK